MPMYQPPSTENPHDPVNWYQGTDGRYYYAPDGKPGDGQPPVKQTERPDQYHLPRGSDATPDPTWKKEASKGYEIHPDQLDTLANRLESDLNTLRRELGGVQRNGNITTAAVGDFQSGQDFVRVASDAQTAFNTYFTDIQNTYTAVIGRLRTTANTARGSENATAQAARQSTDTNGGNPTTSGPNKAV